MTSVENIGNFAKTKEELSVEWQIPNIFSFSGKDVFFESPDFLFCGACWHLVLWPNVDQLKEDPYSGTVALYLYRTDTGPPETIHFTFGIRSSTGVEMKMEDEQEFSLDDCDYCGFFDFLLRSDFKNHESRLMPNNVLTITCELKKDAPSTATGVENWQKSLRSMLMSREGSDIVFKVQGKEFPAHRIILQASSPVFRAMLSHDMMEKQSAAVVIDDCDLQTFSDFLDYIYTGSSEKINSENVLNLYMVSNKFEMDTLKEQCVECIKRNLSVASFCNVMTLALKHDDKALIEFATQFFCNNSSNIVTTTEWQAFYEENSEIGYKLFIKALTK